MLGLDLVNNNFFLQLMRTKCRENEQSDINKVTAWKYCDAQAKTHNTSNINCNMKQQQKQQQDQQQVIS